MFEWLGYKKRLQNVRGELLSLAEGLESKEPRFAPLDVETVARGVVAIARILVRVIDSLP